MKTKKYSAIVFDLGMVLIPFDYNIAVKKFNQIENHLGDRFIEYYNSNYHLHRNFEKGLMTESEFLNEMLTIVDHKIDTETFCKIYSEIFSTNESVVSLLPVLKKNYKLFLLSNTNSIHRKFGWQQCEFIKYFDKLILSYEVKSLKPEEEIYRAVETASGFPSSEHFYIDDIQEYVDAAIKLGWDAVQFVDYDKLLNDLKTKNIL
ncbi:MAG: Alpha-D-glucose 1-phosphate phosphatase YihX [Ignavibacteriaceae bacterium]|nr:Alpha-D-glucose 1-phosphate phosphatase YihX [Ignavibacteriaceae bacterium]MEB2295906.1 HAD family phosphatase [Ignavibacteria bacterium]GIK59157.1 MAG: haloacid dehalogenase [Ignavibacteriota bacterium]GJQ41750.1 MAG: haloacid dehalogenase [Ignavibacteriaceae bacterium]